MAREIFVDGLVQGVGFRAAVSRWGRELGLEGYVKNRADGRVEILVDGPDEKVTFFENMVRAGCGTFAHVDEVLVNTTDKRPSVKGFVIR